MREFDDIERATTMDGQAPARMWFTLRIMRLGSAVLLTGEDGCGEHCERVAREAVRLHSDRFADDPLLLAAYRLQRVLGPLGWRLAALAKPELDEQANRLAASLEVEEWLQRDGEIGLQAYDTYKRVAVLGPVAALVRLTPGTAERLSAAADEAEGLFERLPEPVGMEHLRPIDPWLRDPRAPDPLMEGSVSVLEGIAAKDIPGAAELATELLAELGRESGEPRE